MAAVCVYCASSTRIDDRYVQLAADVGSALARRGHSLVSGGGDLSMMGAVAQAARATAPIIDSSPPPDTSEWPRRASSVPTSSASAT